MDAGDNLGGHRAVARVEVHALYTNVTASPVVATAGRGGTNTALERGAVVGIFSKDGKTTMVEMRDSGYTALCALLAEDKETRIAPVYGVVAETIYDPVVRTTRRGRPQVPVVVPITFQGIEMVRNMNTHTWDKSASPPVGYIRPGDPIWCNVMSGDVVTGVPVGNNATHVYIGVVHVGASCRDIAFQCRVDTMTHDSHHTERLQLIRNWNPFLSVEAPSDEGEY
jgi:hypothetical protein